MSVNGFSSGDKSYAAAPGPLKKYMNYVKNYVKSPLTDLTGTMCTHQHFGRCKDIEMKVINCLEAYGLERGTKTKCSDLISDYEECTYRFKQVARHLAIVEEREKQQLYEPPPKQFSFQ